jgi:hypothetical protein
MPPETIKAKDAKDHASSAVAVSLGACRSASGSSLRVSTRGPEVSQLLLERTWLERIDRSYDLPLNPAGGAALI